MDPFSRLPKTPTNDVLAIVQRFIKARPAGPPAIKQAVNELLELPSVLYFIRDYEQQQINAFATHASRYLELYQPNGSIEIAQTSRYSRITGKNELCILATRPMQTGSLIGELKGSMAELTDEQDRALKRSGVRDEGGTRRDFSVIHSRQMKKNHLFLGPARFVNHDCDNNCELFRDGRYITFRAIKPIAIGDEITAHYGEGYFGKNNRHCLCETCERHGRGGYAPPGENETPDENSDDDDESDSDTSCASIEAREEVDLNVKKTRQGIYLVVPEKQGNDSDDEDEDETDKQSIHHASSSSTPVHESNTDSMSCGSSSQRRRGRPPKPNETQQEDEKMFKPLITTRGQKLREASLLSTASQSLAAGRRSGSASRSASNEVSSRASTRARTAAVPTATPPPTGMKLRDRSKRREGSDDNKAEKLEEKVNRSRSTTSNKVAQNGASKEISERKLDPLVPSCMTCSLPLPADDVDVMAALACKGKGKSKMKEIEKDCTRCERHYAIWGAPWPHRVPTPGSRDSSSRANTPSELGHRVTNATIPTIDQKLQRARLMQLKRNREAHDQEDGEKEAKKARTDVTANPAMARYWASSRASDDRAKVKIENADEVTLRTPTPTVERRKHTKRGGSESAVSDINQKRRRTSESKTSEEEDYSLRGLPPVDEDGDDRRDKNFWPALPSPQPDHMFRRSWLDLRPNPMHVSRWRAPSRPVRSALSMDSTPTLVDDSDDTASDHHPSTPENNECGHGSTPDLADENDTSTVRGRLTVTDGEEEEEQVWNPPYTGLLPALKSRSLICKPNPITVSKLARSIEATELSSDSESGSSVRVKSEEDDDDEYGPPFTHIEEKAANSASAESSASNLYRLQKEADSSTFGSARTSATPEPDGLLISASRIIDSVSSPSAPVVRPASATLTSSPSLAKILNPSLTVGPLHSEFVSDSSVPMKSPSLVSAGWDSDYSATS